MLTARRPPAPRMSRNSGWRAVFMRRSLFGLPRLGGALPPPHHGHATTTVLVPAASRRHAAQQRRPHRQASAVHQGLADVDQVAVGKERQQREQQIPVASPSRIAGLQPDAKQQKVARCQQQGRCATRVRPGFAALVCAVGPACPASWGAWPQQFAPRSH